MPMDPAQQVLEMAYTVAAYIIRALNKIKKPSVRYLIICQQQSDIVF